MAPAGLQALLEPQFSAKVPSPATAWLSLEVRVKGPEPVWCRVVPRAAQSAPKVPTMTGWAHWPHTRKGHRQTAKKPAPHVRSTQRSKVQLK